MSETPKEEPTGGQKPEIYLPPIPIEELPSYLKFNQTPDMVALREQLVQAAKENDWPSIKKLKGQYQAEGEKIVEQLQGDDFDRGKIGMMVAVGLAMRDGYDVILEGIFIKKGWQKVFESIFSWHPDNNFVFTYDISFDETIRRHRNKPNRHEWKESDMADWYKDHDFLGYDFEYKIPESFTQQQTLEFILAKTGVK